MFPPTFANQGFMSNASAPPLLVLVSHDAKTTRLRAEQRAKPRSVSYRFAHLCYRPEPDAIYQLVRVWNFTPTSLGLFLDRPINLAARFYLKFQHLLVGDRTATAIHVTRQEEHWLVGCTVDRPFNAEELQALTM
jgi:hypothetical protein